ncbi:hypothetical protein BDQ17DRAFT_1097364 [Cyathus striatus]|nr:hypothetical protein BDQ17DRAFT_1097364 [Cyathus striatus]
MCECGRNVCYCFLAFLLRRPIHSTPPSPSSTSSLLQLFTYCRRLDSFPTHSTCWLVTSHLYLSLPRLPSFRFFLITCYLSSFVFTSLTPSQQHITSPQNAPTQSHRKNLRADSSGYASSRDGTWAFAWCNCEGSGCSCREDEVKHSLTHQSQLLTSRIH